MQMWFDVLLDGMRHTVSWLKSIDIFEGVSLWSFCLSILLISIIITALVNVVRAPGVLVYHKPEKESYKERSDRLNEEAQYSWYINH